VRLPIVSYPRPRFLHSCRRRDSSTAIVLFLCSVASSPEARDSSVVSRKFLRRRPDEEARSAPRILGHACGAYFGDTTLALRRPLQGFDLPTRFRTHHHGNQSKRELHVLALRHEIVLPEK